MANNTESHPLDDRFEPAFSWTVLDDDPKPPSSIGNPSFPELVDSPLNNHIAFECYDTFADVSDALANLEEHDLAEFLDDLNADDVINDFVEFDPVDASAGQNADGNLTKVPRTFAEIDDKRTEDEAEGNDDGKKDDDREDSPETKRLLRPQSSKIKSGFTTTWVDQDDTGDFDPNEENRQAYLRRMRMKLRQRAPTCQAKSHYRRDQAVETSPEQLVVTLKFQNSSASSQVAQLVGKLPASSPSLGKRIGYSLRKRAHSLQFTYNDSYARKCQRLDDDDLPDDPTGHPFARGCWACVSLGHDCSLLEDEFSWPCATCAEDDTECDLVIAPERKRPCERCKSRKTSCSFKYTLNHGVACQQCMDRGEACLAGPAKDFVRMRVRSSRTGPAPVERVPKIKDHLACADCRESERDCSFEIDGNFGMSGMACAQCVETGSQCCPRDFPPQHFAKPQQSEPVGKVIEQELEEAEKPSPTVPAEAVEAHDSTCGSATRTIVTKFCHPIVFNHGKSAPGQGGCHFCEDAAFGLLGLEKREVNVKDLSDGRGFEEVSGGHRSEGIESTRMCPSCSLDRLAVIMCEEHKLERIPDRCKRKEDEDAALIDLLSGRMDGNRQWCSICPTAASNQCCAASEGDARGCGLLLCLRCAITLATNYGGSLQEMLAKLRDETSAQKPLGLRADFELLKQDGLLMTYLFQGPA